AHRHHVIPMTDGAALRTLVLRESPDIIVPEIEQIDTAELLRLEEDGWTVIPKASAAQTAMDRERIRRLASVEAKVPTSAFAYADHLEEARRAAGSLGFPCVMKAMMSSSGHGMSVVKDAEGVEAAYTAATTQGRVPSPRVMIEEFIAFDQEVTMLTVRHYDRSGKLHTTVLPAVGHARPGTVFHESWQPAELAPEVVARLESIASRVSEALGGLGVFGVECFVRGSDVFFSEASPRPHDTGLVTLASQWNSEFALHARAILGLPYTGPEAVVPGAAHVILSKVSGWAPTFGGLAGALSPPGTRLFLFGKPQAYVDRRLGVAVARGPDVAAARKIAEASAHSVEARIGVVARQDRRGHPS
ncbi:MAG: formate-dependent phosphoribosylglycinamide formyltransferase, partial [Thermoplasmata archaeon]|nr:formate-dependent phosphoribosylglycinamide formyltransferase [Thermoplasmata archaeon]